MAQKHILIDACVAAAAFAPRTTRSAHLVRRASILLQSASTECQPQFLIPNFCIGETFAVFEKYRWGASWNDHVKKSHLTPGQFRTARQGFHQAIHNGATLLQIELNRYHVLCFDLISPINAAYRIKRDRKRKNNPAKKRQVTPASAYDLLLVSMGIWLQRQLGPENFVIATGDARLAEVVKRAKSVNLGRPIRQHLRDVANSLGLTYGPAIYPEVVDLVHARVNSLKQALPGWAW
jgi:hypothetical protein